MTSSNYNGFEIAIIGIAGRFPGAKNPQELWEVIKNGEETISQFSDDELIAEGIHPFTLRSPNYIKSKGIIDNIEYFDPVFFGYTPKEALVMDPQMRLFHECCWEALEDAGYNPDDYKGLIGLFAGASDNLNWRSRLMTSEVDFQYGERFLAVKDLLSTRISYNFNLRGPSTTIYNACSTSLVAVHLACRSLLLGDCNIAMAGGVNVTLPKKNGYFYQEGMLFSKDGHIRAFDEKATGTVFSDGAGIVVLKLLEEAIKDGDNIHAIIKSTAINNDGSGKYSFTAPSEQMQAELIGTAIASAEIDPESIQYIEAHGTGTTLGDPIEIKGMQAGLKTDKKQFCAVGSIKPNVGHLDTVSGVAGLIKTVLALKHKVIPPNIYFDKANPNIDFENSPFYINKTLQEWKKSSNPRRAGVNSFGFGGTNVHLIVEEAPGKDKIDHSGTKINLINISAKTEKAFIQKCNDLFNAVQQDKSLNIEDIAYTLNTGRKKLNYSGTFICSDTDQLLSKLSNVGSIDQLLNNEKNRDVVFMFTGQGAQYINMGRDLYETYPYFKETADQCFEILEANFKINFKNLLYPSQDLSSIEFEKLSQLINQTEYTQPALFIIEYSLAKLMIYWGIKPKACIGHSIGEYVAACIGDVMSLDDALKIVFTRGKLMQQMPRGRMLSISSGYEDVKKLIQHTNIEIAAVNSYSNIVVSGFTEDIDAFENILKEGNMNFRQLHTSHAFHSYMMDPILDEFEQYVSQFKLKAPSVPFVSNLTGTWIEPQDVVSGNYWARQLRGTVNFSDGITTIIKNTNWPLLLELGPGYTLCEFSKNNAKDLNKSLIINLIKGPKDTKTSDVECLLKSTGLLWIYGQSINWANFYDGEKGTKISLPTYPFERRKFWIHGDPFKKGARLIRTSEKLVKKQNVRDWFFVPQWKSSNLSVYDNIPIVPDRKWLIFADECGLSTKIQSKLKELGSSVVIVSKGQKYKHITENHYSIDVANLQHYKDLFVALNDRGLVPDKILHLLSVTDPIEEYLDITAIEDQQKKGFYSLLNIAKAIANIDINLNVKLFVISNNVQKITGAEKIYPGKSTIIGPVKVFNQEFPNIYSKTIDIDSVDNDPIVNNLIIECVSENSDHIIGYREDQRWVQTLEEFKVNENGTSIRLKERGTYLITGGLGSIGLIFAQFLAKAFKARLILLGRSSLPEKSLWDMWLQKHGSDNSTSIKIKAILDLENCGAEVHYFGVDVSDTEKMAQLSLIINDKFGKIDGVVHTAGILKKEAYVPMIDIDEKSCEEQFLPKIQGLLNLENVLLGQKTDFCLITSSFASIIAGVGFSAYASANIFMDYYVLNHNKNSKSRWLTVNWDLWHTPSIGYMFQDKDSTEIDPGIQLENISITAKEGIEVFNYIVMLNTISQIIVSMSDVQAKINKWLKLNERHKSYNDYIEIEQDNSKKDVQYNSYSELELTLIKIWSQNLGNENIDIDDDFFELGGDSLKAIAIVSKVKKHLNCEIHISDLYDKPTIKKLASFIKESNNKDLYTIRKSERKEFYPLSSAQSRLYFLYQLEPGSIAYNEPHFEITTENIDPKLYESLLHKQIMRHEAFRTSFISVDDIIYQKINEELNFKLEYYEANENNYETIIENFVRPFDLSKAPLLRAGLIKLDNGKFVKMVDMHHIIADGSSLSILWKEHRILSEGNALPELKFRYIDFAEWQNSESFEKLKKMQLNYWLNEFKGNIPVLNLPYDFSRPENQTFEGSKIISIIDKEKTTSLHTFAKDQKTTLYIVLFSAFKVLLSKISGQEDIVVGTMMSGRRNSDLYDIVGMFVNTIAIRSKPNASMLFLDYLQEFRQKILKGSENQDCPFDTVLNRLNLKRNLSRNPLFDVEFTFLNTEVVPGVLPEVNFVQANEEYSLKNITAKFDLSLEVLERGNVLILIFTYSTALFSSLTIERFAIYYQRIIQSILNNNNIRISEIEILSSDEKQQLMDSIKNKINLAGDNNDTQANVSSIEFEF